MKKNTELKKSFTIKNTLGLHARAAASLVKITNRFESSVKIQKGDFIVDGKSILGVLSLAAIRGSKISIIVSGEDSANALSEIAQLIESGFGEGIHNK